MLKGFSPRQRVEDAGQGVPAPSIWTEWTGSRSPRHLAVRSARKRSPSRGERQTRCLPETECRNWCVARLQRDVRLPVPHCWWVQSRRDRQTSIGSTQSPGVVGMCARFWTAGSFPEPQCPSWRCLAAIG